MGRFLKIKNMGSMYGNDLWDKAAYISNPLSMIALFNKPIRESVYNWSFLHANPVPRKSCHICSI